jgi:hypothetical protein
MMAKTLEILHDILHLTAKEEITMDKRRTIKLCFHRPDGRLDSTELEQCTLNEARVMVRRALRNAGGAYAEADICIENVYTETIPRAVAEEELVSA